jgi:urease accessory protein
VVSRRRPAYQQLELQVAAGATLEWLPQETIVFSAAQAELSTAIELEGDARLFYWDVVALGRPASGERFDLGHFQAHLDIRRDGRCSGTSASALSGLTVCSTRRSAWTGNRCSPRCWSPVKSMRAAGALSLAAHAVRGDLTQLPGLLVARCLASEALLARGWLIDVWRMLQACAARPRSGPTPNLEHLNTDPCGNWLASPPTGHVYPNTF